MKETFDFPSGDAKPLPVPDQKRMSLGARIIKPFVDTFGLSRGIAALTVFLIGAILLAAVWYFIHLAPPRVITVSTGPEQSSYWRAATNYQHHLASNHITLQIVTSQGSQENLQRLSDGVVDIAFVQSGIADKIPPHIVSLGSISYQPLMIFYRSETNYTTLGQFKGKHLAVGTPGSGTRSLTTRLLATNGVTSSNATFLDFEAAAAAKALVATNADAVFITGDSAPVQVITNLIRKPDIKIFSFTQADAYAKRISYLNKTVIPMGSLDFAANLPQQDITLVAPTVELLAREELHDALVDLLIETAKGVHGRSTLLQRKGEFPKLVELEVPISDEAQRYYNRGKFGAYRILPFWLANVVNRIMLVFVPAVLLLIPTLKLIPILVRLKVRLKLFRWYRALLAVERDIYNSYGRTPPGDLLPRLDEIEKHVSKIKVPASYADQYYTLRGHISFVRSRLESPDTR